MTANEKKRLKAAGKIGFGVARMATGVATFLGYGLLGGFLRRPGQMQACHQVGMLALKTGKELFDEGCRELKS